MNVASTCRDALIHAIKTANNTKEGFNRVFRAQRIYDKALMRARKISPKSPWGAK